jgi:hypothetical protein
MSGFTVELQGLEAFKDTFNTARIPKAVALGTGVAMKQLNSLISSAVSARYATSKPLSSVLIGGSASNVTFGKNIITGDLQYRFVPVFLSDFFSPPIFMGNINPGKTKKGRVHSVEVLRGSRQIVHGTDGRGGFIPIGGRRMIERDGQNRYPTHPLFAPSLSQMAGHIVDNDRSVMYFIDNIYSIIENEIQL